MESHLSMTKDSFGPSIKADISESSFPAPIIADKDISRDGRRVATSVEIRDGLIRRLINSNILIRSWEDEFIRLHTSYSPINAIALMFPNFDNGTMYAFNTRLFIVAALFQLWNIVVSIVFLSSQTCQTVITIQPYSTILYAIEVLLPLTFLGAHYFVIRIWKGKISDSGAQFQLDLRTLINLMLHVLNKVDGSHKLIPEEGLLTKYGAIMYAMLVALIFVLGTSIYNYPVYESILIGLADPSITGELQKELLCYEFYYQSRAFGVPAYVVIGISGVSIIFGVNALYLTGWICSSMIRTWLNRFFPIQRLSIDQLKEYMDPAIHGNKTPRELARELRRDAYEQYFLINKFVKEIGKLWETVIAFIFLFGSIFTAFFTYLFYVFYMTYSGFGATFAMFIFAAALTSLVLIMGFTASMMTYTNSAMMELQAQISIRVPGSELYEALASAREEATHDRRLVVRKKDSGDGGRSGDANDGQGDSSDGPTAAKAKRKKAIVVPQYLLTGSDEPEDLDPLMDFEILGGKTELQGYVSDMPIFWYVYGFAITPAVLKSSFAASFSAVVGYVLSIINQYT